MTSTDVLLRLFSVVILIALNAFFVAAEFSLVSVRRSRISQLVEEGDLQAQTVQSLQRSIDRLLSTTQLGITLSSLALGWIGSETMGQLVRKVLFSLPLPTESMGVIAKSLTLPLAFFLVAYLQIILGELCPKSVALLYPEQLARFLGSPIGAIARIFKPFIWTLNQSTHLLLRLLGIYYTESAWNNPVTSEELRLIINTEGASPELEAEERELLNNIFEFGEIKVEEVMIPRTSVVALPYNAMFQELLNQVTTSGYTRYPIIKESLDEIEGMLDFKDLALPLAQGTLTPETPITNWIQPVGFVPETTSLSDLLTLMQQKRLTIAIVVDEFGGTSGLVTLQDVIREILGDIPDEPESEAMMFQVLDDQTYLVSATMDIEELNELLEVDLPVTDDYQTLGGFLLYQWQKIPNEGEVLAYEHLKFKVISVEGPRLTLIEIYRECEQNNTAQL
jgi:CBS domain containing-hemolysin-like protein